MKGRETLKRVLGFTVWAVLVVGISYVILLPVLSKLSSSLMTERDLYDQTVRWVPKHITLDHYKRVWEGLNYPMAGLNSLLLATVVSILQVASCTFVGYGLARFNFRGRNLLFAIVIVMLVVPPQTVMIPLYMNFRYFTFFGLLPEPGLNLIGSFWPSALMSATGTGLKNGLFIYIFRQFFVGMPRELEEAARVDGAGPVRTFYSIMLPGAIPALTTVFLFSFVWQWNDELLTPLFMRGTSILPIELGGLLYKLGPSSGFPLTGQYASLLNNTGMLLFMAPPLLIYAFMQRHFVESIARTGIVG